jgi:DNA-binding GntR family transcriptional regulator
MTAIPAEEPNHAGLQVERAMEALRQAIAQGDYAPGDRLREADVAGSLAMSRTPIREAIGRLAGEGLVEYQPNRGAVIPRWNRRDLEEIFDIRAYLEGFAAALAAERATSEQISELREISAQMHEAASSSEDAGWDRYAVLNNAFHRRLFACAGNARLDSLLVGLLAVPLLHRSFSGHSLTALRRSNGHHEEILDAIEAREAGWAQAVVSAHVHATRHLLTRGWDDDDLDP